MESNSRKKKEELDSINQRKKRRRHRQTRKKNTRRVDGREGHGGTEQLVFVISKGQKGKAVPLQAWSDPEDSRKLSFPDFMTTAQDGKVSLTHRPSLPAGNTPGTHFC